MFQKVLVANRGEIAVRVLRTLEELGIPSVTVHSTADADSVFARMSGETIEIGPPPVQQSYLRGDEIIKQAQALGVKAIHPGYGLLSENPTFAKQCEDAGITFIGPSSEAIASMGSKTEARTIMTRADVPVVPGATIGTVDPEEVLKACDDIGYPVMLKASGGGGGIGMRIINDSSEVKNAVEDTSKRAKMFFGDPTVYVEKYLPSSRHIEVQILADSSGNVIHLNERECSVQRRHQKVIEEAPSPLVTPELRERMGRTAIEAARAIGYRNAGTVEFLVEPDGTFYFLEMNTRLQVEHPITEFITGMDIVKEQLSIAQGIELSRSQDQIGIDGHSIECRIYAEDPRTGYPSPGTITRFDLPKGEKVRIDTGVENGSVVTPYYDPLIAKLVVHGTDRMAATERMKAALVDFKIEGIKTNIPLLLHALGTESFVSGVYDTNLLKDNPLPE